MSTLDSLAEGQNTGVMMALTMRYFRAGADPKAAIIDAGYCLDAPELMPGGSCIWDQIDDLGWPRQQWLERA